ncbi:hypothetical protein FOZ63_001921 [Perkinsus olseni]|uniref:Uncharacterized protein n=1 Tax=Perkinsus olseni TaxID=32597 RepID=A0A7J6QJR6_PEROL|nr:hypothetical protein FOZ63_001921 [Perkinsus olseni]
MLELPRPKSATMTSISGRSAYRCSLVQGMTTKPNARKTPLLAALYERVHWRDEVVYVAPIVKEHVDSDLLSGPFSVAYASLLRISEDFDLTPTSTVTFTDFVPLFYWFRIGQSMQAALTVIRIAADTNSNAYTCSLADLQRATNDREAVIDPGYTGELVHLFEQLRERFGGPSGSRTAEWLAKYDRVWRDLQSIFVSDDRRLVRERRTHLLKAVERMDEMGLIRNRHFATKLLLASSPKHDESLKPHDARKEHTVTFHDLWRLLCRSALTFACVQLMELVVERLRESPVGHTTVAMGKIVSEFLLMQHDDDRRRAALMAWQEEEAKFILGLVVAAARSTNDLPSRTRQRRGATSRTTYAAQKDAVDVLRVLAERLRAEQDMMVDCVEKTVEADDTDRRNEGNVKLGAFAQVLLNNGLLDPVS